jgi:hypothetical protein
MFNNDTVTIEINNNSIVLTDEAGTSKFSSREEAAAYCRDLAATGSGEWWVIGYEEAAAFLA